MNQQSLTIMQQLHLHGMYYAFENLLSSKQHTHLTPDELLGMLLQAEWEDRQHKKLQHLIRSAHFRYQASLEEINFPPSRNLDKNTLLRLSDCSYIERKENILITGPTGVGKSYIASALGHQACYKGFKTVYFNMQKLFPKLALAKADGSYIREMQKIEKKELLIIDDFGMTTLDADRRMELMEIIEDRHGRNSTIICSQLPVNKWYEVIGESTIADAILDRTINGAHRLELKGDSLRKKDV